MKHTEGPAPDKPVLFQFLFTFRDNRKVCDYIPPEVIPTAVQLNYFDYFNNECRAYGRLKEANREDLAAKCHGYILLTEKMEQRILDFERAPVNRGTEEEPFYFWGNSRYDWARKLGTDFLPIRAIVKDFVPGEYGFTIPEAPRIFYDIVELQRLGILVNDVQEGQWVSGQLIDLDRAITSPHVLLTPEMFSYDLTACVSKWMHLSPEELVVAIARKDFEEFDRMAREWHMDIDDRKDKGEITFRCLPDGERLKRLRPNSVRLYTYIDPRDYDWRTHQFGKGRAVKTTQAHRGQRKRVPKALIRVPKRFCKGSENYAANNC